MTRVIDIFAGPGGLGEGFSSLPSSEGNPAFDVVCSIEKDQQAHKTLLLRTFYRQFSVADVPDAYYEHVRGAIDLDELLSRYPAQAEAAETIAWRAELGSGQVTTAVLRQRIATALADEPDWVLIGGPPCQAYSLAGRSRNRGNADYVPEHDVRQTLYVEYLQILADFSPAVFVMENVKGMLSATLNSARIFHRIVDDLQNPADALRREGRGLRRNQRRCTYRVFSLVSRDMFGNGETGDSIVKCEDYGIPQARHRVILLGVRNDLDVQPRLLAKLPAVPAAHVLADLPAIRSGLSGGGDSDDAWVAGFRRETGSRWANSAARRCGGDDVHDLIGRVLEEITAPEHGRGGEFVPGQAAPEYAPEWYCDPRLGGFCNHSSRTHMARDLHRYLYAACYATVKGTSPVLKDFPADLLPDHANVELALAEGGNFSDRFRVQVRGRPATTITCHIGKDGHYYIHPDQLPRVINQSCEIGRRRARL